MLGVFVIVSCKNFKNLDSALTRAGRLSYHVHLHMPSKDDITKIFQFHLSSMPIDQESINPDILYELLSSVKQNVTCADVAAFCRGALYAALSDRLSVDKICGNIINRQSFSASHQADSNNSTKLEKRVNLEHFLKQINDNKI